MNQEHVILALAGLNILQFFGWSYQVHVLINKLMCKNLAEYSLIKNGPEKNAPIKDDSMAEKEELEILNEVNAMFGVN